MANDKMTWLEFAEKLRKEGNNKTVKLELYQKLDKIGHTGFIVLTCLDAELSEERKFTVDYGSKKACKWSSSGNIVNDKTVSELTDNKEKLIKKLCDNIEFIDAMTADEFAKILEEVFNTLGKYCLCSRNCRDAIYEFLEKFHDENKITKQTYNKIKDIMDKVRKEDKRKSCCCLQFICSLRSSESPDDVQPNNQNLGKKILSVFTALVCCCTPSKHQDEHKSELDDLMTKSEEV